MTVTFTGASGSRFPFATVPIGGLLLPLYGGVYTVLAQTQGILPGWRCLYVGKAESFDNRLRHQWRQHDGLKKALSIGATHFGLMMVSTERERVGIEADLIRQLQPICNVQGIRNNPGGLGGLGGLRWID